MDRVAIERQLVERVELDIPAPADDLAVLSDDFEDGPADVEDRGFAWHLEGEVATQTIADGELELEIIAGNAGGSLWFDDWDGPLLHPALITGAFDARMRARVRNSAGNANPPTSGYRLFGLAAHDPDRSTTKNYVHIAVGTLNGVHSVEWKSTDDSDSAFGGVAWPGGLMDVDLRIVRGPSNLQRFSLYWRASSGLLSSNTGWNLLDPASTSSYTIDRDADVPVRASFGGTAPVLLPNALQVGAMSYSSESTHDVKGYIDDLLYSRPS